jgi:hypothetical protein
MTMRRIAILAVSGLLACGGSESTTTEPVETTGTGDEVETVAVEPEVEVDGIGIRPRTAEEIPNPPAAWETMTAEQKGQYMGAEVMPYMRTLFQEYDAERYASFRCQNCHGATMTERNFEMPNPDILALHPSGSDEQRAMVQAHPRMVRFMFNHVVPAMRQMIGAEEYDAETGEGFSCYFCHPRAEGTEPAAEPTARLDAIEAQLTAWH